MSIKRINLVQYKLIWQVAYMLNNATLLFCIGWAHCHDYAEAASGGVL